MNLVLFNGSPRGKKICSLILSEAPAPFKGRTDNPSLGFVVHSGFPEAVQPVFLNATP